SVRASGLGPREEPDDREACTDAEMKTGRGRSYRRRPVTASGDADRSATALLAASLGGLLLAAFGLRLLRLTRGPLRLSRPLFPLLPTDGAFGTGHIPVAIDEVDVVRVHLEATVGNLLGAAFRNPGLLALNFPNPSVLHVIHEVLFARHSQLCDFLRHLGSPPSESCYRKSRSSYRGP